MAVEIWGFSGRTLVVAFEGWNDAGEAASALVRKLREQLEPVELAELSREHYFDYQFTRPILTDNGKGERVIAWPGISLYGPSGAKEGVYLILGLEPSLSWRSLMKDLLNAIQKFAIDRVVFLGAMLADVPHTRPISVATTSENPLIREQFALERSSYEGPVGITTVLADMTNFSGIPTISIWASVPHYVHNAPSPKATLALLESLENFLPITIDRGSLEEDAETWVNGIDDLAGEDEDMAAYIEHLERARDTVDSPQASGEAIAEEFERYLRKRDDDPPITR